MGRRATFWSKLVVFSSFGHLFFLFLLFFIYSGQKSTFNIHINRSILKSGAPIIFMPLKPKTVSKKTFQLRTKKKIVTKSKIVSKKKTLAKKTVHKKPTKQASKQITKKAVKKTTLVSKKPVSKKKLVVKKPAKLIEKKKMVVKKEKKETKKIEKKVTHKKISKNNNKKVNKEILDNKMVNNVSEGQQPVYIGQQELDALKIQYEIEREVTKHWNPPVGLSKDLSCTVNVLVDWSGKIKQSNVAKPSGVLIYDISARMAVSKLSLPQQIRGKEINIIFNQ